MNAREYTYSFIIQILKLQLLFLLLLTASRVLFFYLFSPDYVVLPYSDLARSFFLGFRIDLALVSYITLLPVLYVFISHLFKLMVSSRLLALYFVLLYLLIGAIVGSDIAFYSYFGERINMMIFGIIDDDTAALFSIAVKNYDLLLIGLGAAFYVLLVVSVTYYTLVGSVYTPRKLHLYKQIIWSIMLILAIFLGARGSVSLFPLLKDIPDISSDKFVNTLARNGAIEAQKALEAYAKAKSESVDFIERFGYGGDISQAYIDVGIDINQTTEFNNLLNDKPPHVVVVMVESFGMAILEHQSEEFDIMRSLKKHFDQDVVFTNFISGANGTIASLEPLLLNLIPRPDTIPYAQSLYLNSKFKDCAATVYERAGYESSFIYGGDLSWRDIGSFFSKQGFSNVYAKADIMQMGGVEEHDWGVYDKHLYQYVLNKLKSANRPQFIFVLTTNNHPPYTLSKHYTPKPMLLPQQLKKDITTDLDLVTMRLKDYQYALDQAGLFLDAIKSSTLSTNTVIALTADNNTIEGVMHYRSLKNSKRVPLYLYLPPYIYKKPLDITAPSSHKDLFPTLYNLTLSDISYNSFGSSLYEKQERRCGFNDSGVLISRSGAFRIDAAQTDDQIECRKRYRASLALTQHLLESMR